FIERLWRFWFLCWEIPTLHRGHKELGREFIQEVCHRRKEALGVSLGSLQCLQYSTVRECTAAQCKRFSCRAFFEPGFHRQRYSNGAAAAETYFLIPSRPYYFRGRSRPIRESRKLLFRQPDFLAQSFCSRVVSHEGEFQTVQSKADPHRANVSRTFQLLHGAVLVSEPRIGLLCRRSHLCQLSRAIGIVRAGMRSPRISVGETGIGWRQRGVFANGLFERIDHLVPSWKAPSL